MCTVGETALHIAASKDKTDPNTALVLCVLLKLQHNADPMVKNLQGKTPIDIAKSDKVRRVLQIAIIR